MGFPSHGKFSVYPVKPVKDEVGIEERLSRPAQVGSSFIGPKMKDVAARLSSQQKP